MKHADRAGLQRLISEAGNESGTFEEEYLEEQEHGLKSDEPLDENSTPD